MPTAQGIQKENNEASGKIYEASTQEDKRQNNIENHNKKRRTRTHTFSMHEYPAKT
jgi:uncharacterized protein (DUF927 family)